MAPVERAMEMLRSNPFSRVRREQRERRSSRDESAPRRLGETATNPESRPVHPMDESNSRRYLPGRGDRPGRKPRTWMTRASIASTTHRHRHGDEGHRTPAGPSPSPSSPSPFVPQRHLSTPGNVVTAPPRSHLRRAATLPMPMTPLHRTGQVAVAGEPGQDGQDEGQERPRRRCLFCLGSVQSRRTRLHIVTCLVSGIAAASLLAVYVALTVTQNIRQGELTIAILLVILAVASIFAYSLVRLLLLKFQPDRLSRRRRPPVPDIMGHRGYAVPPKPIPVVLARDEDAVGIEREAGQLHPPAYGLWRESVRVDPNMLFWQRNANAEPNPLRLENQPGPRPPSYASDDGISYVVEARPRSVAPPTSFIYTSDAVRATQRQPPGPDAPF
ncbi:hypothetical protein DCS_05166 [Drechmeria coniospora]|uniref:Uncharacterized protein n=1 Tax=Drechmeria coniospora TaxID=98403 RepID=A0A151GM20_DRECN|nr:hypothetical protein DCS_05166 [Drechmeria coniospora]KYK58153.1 hypothetical protein DCS_05166 [Drechmeria coniospora]